MNNTLTEKQLHSQLDKYYKKYYGERDTDEWYVNPAPNMWKFERSGVTIILTCDMQTGKITEQTG